MRHLIKSIMRPLKRNRLVSSSVDSGYQRVETLAWTETQATQGQLVHIKKFPKGHQVKVFRLASDSGRTDSIATNDLSQDDTKATRETCRLPWKIEQLHRELKQTTGIGKCQCRNHRVSLRRAAKAAGQTIYQLKEGLLDDYIRHQLQNPAISINIA